LAFKALDFNQSGAIEVSELRTIFIKDDSNVSIQKALRSKHSSMVAFTDTFSAFDKDGDGKVTLDEFKETVK